MNEMDRKYMLLIAYLKGQVDQAQARYDDFRNDEQSARLDLDMARLALKAAEDLAMMLM